MKTAIRLIGNKVQNLNPHSTKILDGKENPSKNYLSSVIIVPLMEDLYNYNVYKLFII